MDFQLTDEQRQLSDSLERLLAQQYGVDQRKAIIGSQSGFSAAIWSKLAELGILSLPVSEKAGGFGGGAVDLIRPMALVGQALVVEPVLAQLTAQRLLDKATARAGPDGSDGKQSALELLQQAVAGEQRLAWAQPSSAHARGFTASASGKDWTLNGTCTGVFGAEGAGHLLATARTADAGAAGAGGAPGKEGPALFLVPANAPGVSLRGGRALDNQRIADVSFDGVRLSGAQKVASGSGASDAIEDAADFASALLCAEAVGLIDYACQATLEYLKTRKQFGTTIGSFQALQHRIVDLHVELEQVRSMAALACSKYDAAGDGQIPVAQRTKAVAGARVLVGKAATKVAQESVQLHGGMGMAEELKISHTFRRLTVLAQQSGNVSFFLDRFIAADRQL